MRFRGLAFGKTRRRTYLLACLTLLGLSAFQSVIAQGDGDRDGDDQKRQTSQTQGNIASSKVIPSPTSTSSTVPATQTPLALIESQIVQSSLDATSQAPARFFFTQDLTNPTEPLYVTASLCSGPGIPPYNVTDSNVLKQLGMKYYEAQTATLPSLYVSTDQANQNPGPDNLLGEPDVVYFFGGLAYDVNTDKTRDGVWISIYPPQDTRNVTGTWQFLLGISTEVAPIALRKEQGLSFADSDRDSALLMTYNASQGLSPNLTLAVLPTDGPDALPDAYYFNSSVCAISAAFKKFNSTQNGNQPQFNQTETQRGSIYRNTTRAQWLVSELQAQQNYTAWLIDVGQNIQGVIPTSTMWPAIKFVTKRSTTCRLVYDVDFCPSVAYSIPVGPDVATDRALSIINATVQPNFANFSATLDTFPCGSKTFGQFSALKTCDDCRRAYQDWLCAVTMPRCTDSLQAMNNETTAAEPDPYALLGIATPPNEELLPYIINRQNDSRQPYIDAEDGLDADKYGELLPCIQTCYQVASSCPQPLIQWYCPLWDITAQSQYGTFADTGAHGLGVGQNGGAGVDGQRWGGPTEFIAQDAFGNVYCNSMNVERQYIAVSAAARSVRHGNARSMVLAFGVAMPLLLLIFL